MGDAQDIDATSVRFVNDDGRCVFEVEIVKGKSEIEIRAVDMHKADGVIHNHSLCICTQYTNQVIVKTIPYDR